MAFLQASVPLTLVGDHCSPHLAAVAALFVVADGSLPKVSCECWGCLPPAAGLARVPLPRTIILLLSLSLRTSLWGVLWRIATLILASFESLVWFLTHFKVVLKPTFVWRTVFWN